MMLTIAVISLIGMLFSMVSHILEKGEIDFNTFLTVITIIAW